MSRRSINLTTGFPGTLFLDPQTEGLERFQTAPPEHFQRVELSASPFGPALNEAMHAQEQAWPLWSPFHFNEHGDFIGADAIPLAIEPRVDHGLLDLMAPGHKPSNLHSDRPDARTLEILARMLRGFDAAPSFAGDHGEDQIQRLASVPAEIVEAAFSDR
jgi:hypothetical protein